MRNPKIITILALMISLVVGFTSDVNAQTVKQDSVVFYKNEIAKCNEYDSNWYLYDKTTPTIIKETIQNDSLVIRYTFNKKNVKVHNMSIFFIQSDYNNNFVKPQFIWYKSNNKDVSFGHDEKDVYNINKSFDINDSNVKTIDISFWNGTKPPYIGFFKIEFTNLVINYEYTDNTSINDVKANTPDIQFINNKFESSTKIDNVKVYDMTGKLIQEGTINDTYQLDKNTLYFALFDDKFSKKIWTN